MKDGNNGLHKRTESKKQRLRTLRSNSKHTDATKQKQSKSRTGKICLEKTKEKLRQYNGIKASGWIDGRSLLYTMEHKEKLAGRKRPKECEICGVGTKLICFDHNHKTGKFRGWICWSCNIVLGHVKDSVETLEKLIVYLK